MLLLLCTIPVCLVRVSCFDDSDDTPPSRTRPPLAVLDCFV